jgi:hypothetical protein
MYAVIAAEGDKDQPRGHREARGAVAASEADVDQDLAALDLTG